VSEINGTSRALAFRDLFAAVPMEHMVSNLTTRLGVHNFGTEVIPITINSNLGYATCYLCCPSVAYIDYAREELRHFSSFKSLSRILDALLRLGHPLIRAAQLDRQVQVNNWLLATNPLLDIAIDTLRVATDEIAQMNPGHVVVWRSLNAYSDQAAISVFRQVGYKMYPARQIYLFDCRTASPKFHRDEQRDRALLEQGDFEFVSTSAFRDNDYARAQLLYQHLYLEKYTWLNPQYTQSFIKSMHTSGIIELQGLRAGNGELSGVIGFFDSGLTMTAPVVGYDKRLPPATGLYRMLMALATKRARERKLLFNMSAGAASFKRNRGGIGALEYTAVYDAGLRMRHRLAGVVVRKILEWVGIPLLRAFEL
jgi:hypothetical protein